eukprot:TRINITY_DN245_c0_g1_i1.p3 TRINITY_DN245_c0_g1~~TRINITY_DN245_c0_g1_i1.p3  ORF type:complete len:136 (+),score=43.80 TRINITY_DN245_c0_g1_i1:518-925(+)
MGVFAFRELSASVPRCRTVRRSWRAEIVCPNCPTCVWEEELEGGEEEELEGGEEEELEEELECGEEEWFQAPADVSVCFVCFQEECRCLQPEDGEEERPRDPPPDDLLDYEDELALEAQARQLHHSPYTVGRFCG